MKIHRLYPDEHGETHWQDVDVEFGEATKAGRLSKRIPATGIAATVTSARRSSWNSIMLAMFMR